MLKELKKALVKGQTVSIQTIDGAIEVGNLEDTSMVGKVKLRNEKGVFYISNEDIKHVTRIFAF